MINRNLSSTAKENHVVITNNAQERKLRTRTLIQAGGLLSLSGLFEACDILEGEDLQNDLDGRDKAATLLGILIDASEKLLQNNNILQMEKFKRIGQTKLKVAAAKYS